MDIKALEGVNLALFGDRFSQRRYGLLGK
jgi:hypothetical protein